MANIAHFEKAAVRKANGDFVALKTRFISGVQKEFVEERLAIKAFLDMISLCHESGLREPEFRQDGGQFVQTLWRPVQPEADQGQLVGGESGLEAQSRAQSEAQSRPQSELILLALSHSPLSAAELIGALNLSSKTGAFKRTIQELLGQKLIEYTLPEKPTSRLQKYRISSKGLGVVKASDKGKQHV